MRRSCTRNQLSGGLIALLLCLSSAEPLLAASPAEQLAVRAAETAMAIARADGSRGRLVAQFAQAMRRYGAVGMIADFSLGQYRRALPASRRDALRRHVEDFAGGMFATYVGDFAGQRLEILGSTAHGPGDVVVRSRIVFADGRQPSGIDWRIIRTGRGPKVFDMKVRGIWLTLRMRSYFVSILKQNHGDFDALFAKLR